MGRGLDKLEMNTRTLTPLCLCRRQPHCFERTQCTIPVGAIPDDCRIVLAMRRPYWGVEVKMYAKAPRFLKTLRADLCAGRRQMDSICSSIVDDKVQVH